MQLFFDMIFERGFNGSGGSGRIDPLIDPRRSARSAFKNHVKEKLHTELLAISDSEKYPVKHFVLKIYEDYVSLILRI